MKEQLSGQRGIGSKDAFVKDCVGSSIHFQRRSKDSPVSVRVLLEETYGSVYSISAFIEKFVLPSLSSTQQELLQRKLLPLLAVPTTLKKSSLKTICESLRLSTAVFQQVQTLFQETLITSIQASPPSLTKVRQPVVPPYQSLKSLVQDIIWTLLQQQNKKLTDRTANNSRFYIKHILCQGYTTGHPTATTACLKVQKQINSAMEYCSTSSLFQILHTTLLGDDILRFLFLNFNIFIPISPMSDHSDEKNVLECETAPAMHSAKSRRRKCKLNDSSKILNYWQVSGIPFHSSSSTKGSPNKRVAINTTVLNTCGKKSRAIVEDLLTPSTQPVVPSGVTHALSKHLLMPPDGTNDARSSNRKSTRNRKRRRPIASLDPIYDLSESKSPHPLSPKACLCRKALFYSNSYTPSIGAQGLFMMPSSSIAPTTTALMTPIQLWDSMTLEWTQFQLAQSASVQQQPISPVILNLCSDILRRHSKKTDYHRLLQRHCPLPARVMDSTSAVSLSDLTYQYVSPEGVISFVQACLHSVLPSTFWNGGPGCSSQEKNSSETGKNQETNESVFLQQIVPLFVKLRRNERLGNKMLLQNIRITKMSWIKSDDEARRKVGATRLDHEFLKLQVLSIFRWLFHGYIIPLLHQCFYITESEMHGKRVLYYRKPIWALFRTLSMSKLLGSTTKNTSFEKGVKEAEDGVNSKAKKIQYVEVAEADVLRRLLHEDRQMGVCKLRLVPKASGVRPIATLNKREFITPVVPTSNSTAKPNQSSLSEILDIGELELNDDEEMDTPLGPARKKTRRDVVTDSSVLTSTLHELPPTRIRLTNQSRASTNTMLSDIFSVLTFERDRKNHSFGSGLSGMHDFYPRYRFFLQHWKNNAVGEAYPRQQLYFGSVDIRHCYDNIDQEHLLSVISNAVLTDDHYVVQKYNVYKPERQSDCPLTVTWQSKKEVSLLEELEPFRSKVRVLSHERRGSIFVDGVNTIVMSKEQIMNQLRAHLTGHVVVTKGRYGNRYLLQSTGIPQGSILSTILCNFYYGEVEGRLFDSQHDHDVSSSVPMDIAGSHLLARMVDDFLLVTTDIDDLRNFFETMHRGDTDLGVTINQDKTRSSIPINIVLDDDSVIGKSRKSFDILPINQMVSSGSYFSWCGMMFDTHTGEVRIDYSRFVDGKGGDSLTVDRVSHEGDHLLLQMKQFVRPRCLPILYDPMINTMPGRVFNFYQMMVYAAVKTSEYLKSLQNECPPSSSVFHGRKNVVMSNIPFLIKCIDDTVQFGSELIQLRVRTTLKSKEASDLSITSTELKELPPTAPFLPLTLTTWLGWRSFYDVFRGTKDFQPFAEAILSHRVHRVPYDHYLYPFHVEATVQQALEGMDLANLLSNHHHHHSPH
jgi:Telomerase ribonucleoprotein complex - RNA binding domain